MIQPRIKRIFSFILPFTVLIIVPSLIVDRISINSIYALIAGLILVFTGLMLMGITISLFSRVGKGTLAPWSPPNKLVILGPYKYVRNPMIIGVLIVLIGESVIIASIEIFFWALIFFLLNNLYFIFYEEPNLEKRFGDEYKEYRKNVSRWIPRKKPYNHSNI